MKFAIKFLENWEIIYEAIYSKPIKNRNFYFP